MSERPCRCILSGEGGEHYPSDHAVLAGRPEPAKAPESHRTAPLAPEQAFEVHPDGHGAQNGADEFSSGCCDCGLPSMHRDWNVACASSDDFGPSLATADDVIERRARYADTPGGHADAATRRAEALERLREQLTGTAPAAGLEADGAGEGW